MCSKPRFTTPLPKQNFSNLGIGLQLGHPGEKVASAFNDFLGFSILKQALDSTVLAHVMKTLNERYNYGLNLFLLSIDEGITGYRDDSIEVRLIT